jgi:hypothetical protein
MFSKIKPFHLFEGRGTDIEQNWIWQKAAGVCENAGGYGLDAAL